MKIKRKKTRFHIPKEKKEPILNKRIESTHTEDHQNPKHKTKSNPKFIIIKKKSKFLGKIINKKYSCKQNILMIFMIHIN